MLPRLVTAPAEEPITLDEAKAHLRLQTTDDDDYVTALIQAARQHAEEYLWRGIVTQTWEMVLERFPDCDFIRLERGNLGSIVSVTYVDGDGVEQTMSAEDYAADTASEPGRLMLAYGASWPSARCQWDAVKVRYTVGWAVAAVPKPIKQALLLLVSQLFEHRTPVVYGAVASIPFAVEALLGPYRLVRF